MSEEAHRELRGVVISVFLSLPGFVQWLPPFIRLILVVVGISVLIWTFRPRFLEKLHTTFGLALALCVGVIAGGILQPLFSDHVKEKTQTAAPRQLTTIGFANGNGAVGVMNGGAININYGTYGGVSGDATGYVSPPAKKANAL